MCTGTCIHTQFTVRKKGRAAQCRTRQGRAGQGGEEKGEENAWGEEGDLSEVFVQLEQHIQSSRTT